MKLRFGQLLAVCCLSFLIVAGLKPQPLAAQVAGATLSGTITDAQGGAVPNAKVSVKNVATGVASETTTNGAGVYTVPNLNAGDYEVTVSSAGFNTTLTKLNLTVGAKQELNLALMVGQVVQTVEVTGAAPQVELESSTISGNVNANTVRELPLNGRDWASLATLEPSVVQARTQRSDPTQVGGAGGRGFGDQLSVSGSRPTQNSYRLDGVLVNDYSNAGPGSVLGKNLGVDAIQEFTVLTSNYSAEYGFTSGGVINAITRSGTNSFHGSGFEFLRNDKFDAANFFTNASGLQKNFLRQNQFGASAGWKILNDKLFLFGSYEGVRLSKGLPVTGQTTISDAVRAGNVVNLTTGALVHVASIDPNIQKYLALYPHPLAGAAGCAQLQTGQFSAPGVPGGCNPNVGNFSFTGTQKATENFVTSRADYKFSDKDSVFATYLRDPSIFYSPLAFNNEFQSFSSYRQAIVAEETHIFSPAWVNSIRVGLNRTTNLGGNSPIAINPAAGDPSLGMLPGFDSAAVTLTGTQATVLPGGVGGGASIQDFWGQIFQVYDDAFYTRGNHGMKFGFSFLSYHGDAYTPLANYNGTGTFSATGVILTAGSATPTPTAAEGNVGGGTACYSGSGSVTNGNSYDASCGALVNFLTNQPQAATRPFASQPPDIVNKHYLRDKIVSGYFQDDWRLRSNLTLNLGLRYEFATIPTEKYGEIAMMPSPTTILPCGSPVSISTPCPSAAVALAGLTQPAGDPATVLRNTFWSHNPTKKDFEPRIGFAWDPFHNGKTAVRGGFGVFDALPLPYQLLLNSTSSRPWRSTLQGVGNNILPSAPQGVWPFGIPALTTAHITNPTSGSFWYIDNNIQRNYVYQYNLNVQRQVTSTTTVLIGYTGARAFHNPFQADTVNTIIPTLVSGVGYVWPLTWSNATNTTQLNAFCPTGAAAIPGCNATAVVNSRRLNPSAGSMFNTMYESRSWYNGMQVKVDKRMSHGFQLQGAFTWSKSMDDSSGSTAGDTFSLDPVSTPWYDLSLDKGLSDFDVRRNLVINGLWNVPTTKSLGSAGEKLLGGWQLGLILRAGDGVPVPISLGTGTTGDIAGEATTTLDPPNLASGCNLQSMIDGNYRTSLTYLNGFGGNTNTACLTLTPRTPANAAFCDSSNRNFSPALAATTCANIRGNLGRDVLIGPPLVNTDFSIFKNNYVRRVSEAFNLQFRAEIFNVFNRTNFAPPSAANTVMLSANNGSLNTKFGQLTSTQGDNRIIQFAIKAIW